MIDRKTARIGAEMAGDFAKEILALRKKLDIAKDTLKFYATKKHFEKVESQCDVCWYEITYNCLIDDGKKARDCLRSINRGEMK